MKTIVLSLSLIFCFADLARAQGIPEPVTNDSLDSSNVLHLIDTPITIWPEPEPVLYPWIDLEPWPYYWPSEQINFMIYPYVICGEARYDNGMLYSRCECNADSVRHGKSVFWEINGKISSVSYYRYGKVYTQKSYSDGKVTKLENFTYRNSEQLLHGKHILYTDEGKIISYFHFGKQQGLETEYRGGYVYAKRQHKNGIQLHEQTFDPKGRMLSESHWSEKGVRISTVTIDPEINQTTYTTYHENGNRKEIRRMVGDLCLERYNYSDTDVNFHTELAFNDGSPKYYFDIDSTQTALTKEWSPEGEIITEWRRRQNKVLGSGFCTSGQQRTEFKQVFNSDGSDHLECWTFLNGDTNSFYYAHNRHGGFNDIIYDENKFIQHTGKAVKHGTWTLYQNNSMMLKENYSYGVLYGKWQQFTLINGIRQLKMEGDYTKGVRTGFWTVNTDSCLYQVLYAQDTMVGKILKLVGGKLSQEIMFNQFWDASNRIYLIHDQGVLKWNCRYLNDVPHGKWTEFHPDSTVKGYGIFEHGQLKSKWIELIPKKNGKMKKVRQKVMELPKPVFPNIHELLIDTSV